MPAAGKKRLRSTECSAAIKQQGAYWYRQDEEGLNCMPWVDRLATLKADQMLIGTFNSAPALAA